MANSLNHCILIGDVPNAPDIECIGDRELVVRFTLVTERLNGDGATDSHCIVCRGQQAEIALDHVRTGKKLQIVGEIAYNASYIGFGQVARTAEILAHRIEPLRPEPTLCALAPRRIEQESVAA